MKKLDSLLSVIRHAEERSFPLSLEALKRQTLNFKVVNIIPHIEAVKQTFFLGTQTNAAYLLSIDADVVLKKNAIEEILDRTEKAIKKNGYLAYLEFYTQDKFRGPITSGCHLYVNRFSPIFFEHFKQYAYDPKIFRPESKRVFPLLRELGLEWAILETSPVGYHDYEQYFFHLFVKWRNIAVKYVQRRPPRQKKLEETLKKLMHHAPCDLDYSVAFEGFKEGLQKSTVLSNANDYEKYRIVIEKLGIREKKPIKTEERDLLLDRLYSMGI